MRFIIGILALCISPQTVFAEVPLFYTNDNIFVSEHDVPATLNFDERGGFYGITETGMLYAQVPVLNTLNVRMHKFTIGEAYFYMTDRGLINASDDLAALSIYFSRA